MERAGKGVKPDEDVGLRILVDKPVEMIDVGPRIGSAGRGADAGPDRETEERGARCWHRCVWILSGVSEPRDDCSFCVEAVEVLDRWITMDSLRLLLDLLESHSSIWS